jgi:hypothetical protein
MGRLLPPAVAVRRPKQDRYPARPAHLPVQFIETFDTVVRRIQGVFEFSASPDAVFRLRRTRLRHPILLPDGGFPSGTPFLELHLWNERIPRLPTTGPDLAWASRASRRLRRSLHEVAAFVQKEAPPRASLVGATTILVDGPAAGLLLRRLGFELQPHAEAYGALVERIQNRYRLALMAAFNPLSLRGRTSSRIRRTDLWMTMEAFLQRYGDSTGQAWDA